MKFYDRRAELAELQRIQRLAMEDHSRLTVVTGRRRIGKTSLITRACEAKPTAYLFVSRSNEAVLCRGFVADVSTALGIYVPEEISSFASLFKFLMQTAQTMPFNLIVDEFQEFFNINPSIYSDMQNIWDQYRLKTKMNLIVSGSVYSLMSRIFESEKEPLFGRSDAIMCLSGFSTETLKEILHDYAPDYTAEDLLALYTFTGGVPKYIEQFCDNNALTKDAMIDFMIRENSMFIDEGKNILIEEFGKDYGTYFSILGSIAGGINTQSAIEAAMGGKSIGGNLKRLIEDYNVIRRVRPIMSKEGTQSVRYEINDNLLRFWFKYINRNRAMIEIGNYRLLGQIIKDDYPTYSGLSLERYFKQQLAESMLYREIDSWWDPKDKENQREIDIVAIGEKKNTAFAFEVKRNGRNYNAALMQEKVAHLKAKVMAKYSIGYGCLSMDDM
ncbi:MAG: ATP-binding protein [Tidjanibacter sp.]|nr:ATP-binding protein [Tidjanibacter sp.]